MPVKSEKDPVAAHVEWRFKAPEGRRVLYPGGGTKVCWSGTDPVADAENFAEQLRAHENVDWATVTLLYATPAPDLSKRVAELEEALKPFSEVDTPGYDDALENNQVATVTMGDYNKGPSVSCFTVTLGDFRRARSALQLKPRDEAQGEG